MNNHKVVLFCVLATVFGFIGASLNRLQWVPQALAQANNVIAAQEFQVIDANGRLRGKLSAKNPNGWVRLLLMDQQGRDRMSFNVNQEGGAFVLLFDQRNPGQYDTSFGMPSISLIGPDGKITASLQ